mgnify:CR=1 FL=1
MSRYTNDMDRISDALTDSLSDMLSSALTVVGIFCLMLVISPILTLVTLVTVPLMFGVPGELFVKVGNILRHNRHLWVR